MFSYNKINIIDITKNEPLGIIRDVLIIGSSKNNDHVAEYYIQLESQIIRTDHHDYDTMGYMRATIPLRLLNDMHLYIGFSTSDEKAMFFIEPKYYHLLGEDEINSLVLKSKSANIAGEINEDLPEPLKEFYLPESVYYELTGSSREEYGHQYITKPLIEKIASGEKEFYEHFDYITHYEPLTFYLNRKQLIFLSDKDLGIGTMRLLQTNNEGVLFEKDCFYKDNFEEAMQYGRNSVRDSMRLEEIKLEVEDFMSFNLR